MLLDFDDTPSMHEQPNGTSLSDLVRYKNAGRALAPALLEFCQVTETSPDKVSIISD